MKPRFRPAEPAPSARRDGDRSRACPARRGTRSRPRGGRTTSAGLRATDATAAGVGLLRRGLPRLPRPPRLSFGRSLSGRAAGWLSVSKYRDLPGQNVPATLRRTWHSPSSPAGGNPGRTGHWSGSGGHALPTAWLPGRSRSAVERSAAVRPSAVRISGFVPAWVRVHRPEMPRREPKGLAGSAAANGQATANPFGLRLGLPTGRAEMPDTCRAGMTCRVASTPPPGGSLTVRADACPAHAPRPLVP